ncbi:hypothetical protein [Nostoc sp.]|uniref:hypothetical protein n=1 Tax=Nostoc sp. TaxID=1180 RepID=UPI002FFA9B15
MSYKTFLSALLIVIKRRLETASTRGFTHAGGFQTPNFPSPRRRTRVCVAKPVRSSPYSPLGILRQALASPFGRRGDAKGDSAAVANL